MNVWNISGGIKNFGVKGVQYPKLWVQLELDVPTELQLPSNNVFVTFDLDKNPNTKAGKISEFVQSSLDKSKFAIITEAMVTWIKFNTKGEGDTWVSEDRPGLKANIRSISISPTRIDPVNVGLVFGKVIKAGGNKLAIEERYRVPNTNEWKSREIPILCPAIQDTALYLGKMVFVQAKICGSTPEGESKTYGVAQKLIVT